MAQKAQFVSVSFATDVLPSTLSSTITKGGGSVTRESGTLDPRLLAVLACPDDKGPLYYIGDHTGLYNPRLHRCYEVRDGIPVMLIDEARTLDQAAHDQLMTRIADEGITPTFTVDAPAGNS